jgi:hypothetical protein
VLPRLQETFSKVAAEEAYNDWVISAYEPVKAERDAAAAELRALYAPLVTRLADLLGRIEAIDAEVKRVNNSKPTNADAANGDGRFLYGVETHARGAGRLNETLLARDLKLPHWTPADGYAWPPHRPALQFKLSELEEKQIRQQRDAVRQRARDVATEVERQRTGE